MGRRGSASRTRGPGRTSKTVSRWCPDRRRLRRAALAWPGVRTPRRRSARTSRRRRGRRSASCPKDRKRRLRPSPAQVRGWPTKDRRRLQAAAARCGRAPRIDATPTRRSHCGRRTGPAARIPRSPRASGCRRSRAVRPPPPSGRRAEPAAQISRAPRARSCRRFSATRRQPQGCRQAGPRSGRSSTLRGRSRGRRPLGPAATSPRARGARSAGRWRRPRGWPRAGRWRGCWAPWPPRRSPACTGRGCRVDATAQSRPPLSGGAARGIPDPAGGSRARRRLRRWGRACRDRTSCRRGPRCQRVPAALFQGRRERAG
mmetsp:Transcript_15438/g.48525  ORF Transcript_15438/g.48525 Transcript_15438/m.48525 type:complete len:316 (-) Transcript_15438:647-1594(-)